MTTLTQIKLPLPCASMNGESTLPPLSHMIPASALKPLASTLDEDDGLYLGYGRVGSSFPYRWQDNYDRSEEVKLVDCIVLENDYLRAELLPEYGGRLRSLFDKVAGKDLLFTNPVIRPCNLAVRNAWLSGGVEWNCGFVGHHPYTCSTLHTAKLTLDDGTPVVRMYEFERVRRCVYQMDFFLPESSKLLYVRVRIVNPNTEVTPMYWWSNMAVPELQKGRVISGVTDSYSSRGTVCKVPVPICDDIDITYPVNNPHAIDFFWHIPDEKRKYITQVDENGYGLIQTSTKRLKGRKLFVWGQGPGGDRWQDFLTVHDSGLRYAEIQAGVAHTQYECLPMPPQTTWEWLEGYGAVTADANKVHGEWEDAKAETERALDEIITESALEAMLKSTHAMATRQADETLISGSGWGALENLRRQSADEQTVCPHLDFGLIDDEQAQWQYLLANGHFQSFSPNDTPPSWMQQPEWLALIEKSAQRDGYNWYTHLQLGITYAAMSRFGDAKAHLTRSIELENSCWALFGLAEIARMENDPQSAAALILRAAELNKSDISLAKEAVRLLSAAKNYTAMIALISALPQDIAQNGRIRISLAEAYTETGEIEKAEAILYADGGLTVPDIREGEISITNIWYKIQKLKAEAQNIPFDPAKLTPPAFLDFRMDAVK